MAREYDNTNRGLLGRNTRRRNDKDPEYSGSINIEGVDYWLNGWVKDGKHGKFFSLTVRPKVGGRKGMPAPAEDTNIPF